MAKGKTTKRERKFAAKGGVKARLDKGGTIAPKGKVKRKRREQKDPEAAIKKAKRDQKNADDYARQKKAQRDSEDFVGRENLGELDVGSFFANFEEDLKQEVSSDDDSDREIDAEASKIQSKDSKKRPKGLEDSDENDDGSSEDESSEDEDEEETPLKKAKGASKPDVKQQRETKKRVKEVVNKAESDESSEDENENTTPAKKSKTALRKNRKQQNEGTSDSDSGSDDEDIEAVEAKMRAQMKKLERQDPEFHEFLQENEQSLLEFGGDDGPESSEKMDIDGGDDVDDDREGAKSIELTPKVLKNLEHGAFVDHGIKSLRKIVKAYKSACLVVSPSGDGNAEAEGKKNSGEKTYHIEDSQVFDSLMVTCLDGCHEEFYLHLLASDEEREKASNKSKKAKRIDSNGARKGKKDSKMKPDEEDEEISEDEKPEEYSDDKPLDPKILERSSRWAEVKPILSTFLKATLHLVSESKEPDLLAIVLKAMSKYVRYMTPFPRIAEHSLKVLTSLWSAPLGDSSSDYQVVRLNSFLRIRQLALTQPFPFIEDCLKKTYLAYARRAKFGGSSSISSNTLPTLTFMGNCLVELYSLDYHSSYQHAFVYIRQLALFLRTAMQKKTPEAFQNVYCWQYIHCLKLWVAVLSASCKQSNLSDDSGEHQQQQLLRSLVFPLTEVIIGTIRLAPAPARHLPLRFHCVRLLQQLAAATETFIPTASFLLETFDLKEFSMKPKKIKGKGGGATTRGVHLPFLLKFSKEDPLRTSEEHEACITELFKLLNREVDLYRYSAGFPEFSMQLVQRLKKFSKDTKNSRWRAYSRGCIDQCQKNSDFAVEARAKLAEAPKDVKNLECLRQPKDPSMGERYDKSVAKENSEWSLLMGGTTTTGNSNEDGDDRERQDHAPEAETEKKEEKNKQKKQKKKKAPKTTDPAVLDEDVLEEQDEVQEGIDWSSEEED